MSSSCVSKVADVRLVAVEAGGADPQALKAEWTSFRAIHHMPI
jgi:hypothetical protein